MNWLRRLLVLFSARPGDQGQRARAIAHYGGIGASYGDAARGGAFIDALWSRFLRPREVRAVMEVIDARAGESILDVGCGSGTYARLLVAQNALVTAVDASESMVEAVRPLVADALVADLEALALERKYDRVICLGVLDFVAEPERCLQRLAGHLKEEGALIVLVPRRGFLGLYYRVAKLLDGMRVNTFDLRGLDALAARCGLVREAAASPLPNSLVVRWRKLAGMAPG